MNALTSYFNSPSKTVVSLDTGKTTRFKSEVIGIDLGDLADCTEVTTETLKQIEQLTARVSDSKVDYQFSWEGWTNSRGNDYWTTKFL